ncbi:MAG: hypothetical protein NC396_05785 [Bacteroides sp.]|nr:hypothetical protein [Bacteroides sp.]MCM1085865.1 hypothetical protein [Bacteroides sp.]
MKRKISRIAVWAMLSWTSLSFGFAQGRLQQDGETQYKRSSLYSLLLAHPDAKYSKQIDYVYLSLPPADKYEDHNMNVRRISAPGTKQVAPDAITRFCEVNHVARRLVAKWFDRDADGNFDLNLIARRGNYNASEMDVQQARMSKRGLSLLSDAGEQLIGNTFVIVNDIVYVDKEKQAKTASLILSIIGAAANAASAASGSSEGAAVGDGLASLAFLGAVIADNLGGFTVKVRTHLLQLDWNDSIADTFYSDYWVDKNTPEEERAARRRMFDQSPLFGLRYIGYYDVKSEKTVLKGVNTPEDVITKVCARGLDKAIVGLQQKYEAFKVKTPVMEVRDGKVIAKIGMKEGLTAATKFEVLQQVEKDGKTVYRRVGTVAPEKKLIWDNRFMAAEEQAAGSELTATTFKTLTGGPFYPGMLIRQLK